MEKVQIIKEQEIMLSAFKTEEDNSMMTFVRDNTTDHNSAFRWFNEEELALIWMGHYEIKKDNIEVLQEEIEYSLNNHSMSGYAVGYRDGLKFAKNVLEGEK